MKVPWSDSDNQPQPAPTRAPEAPSHDDERHKLDIARIARGMVMRRKVIFAVAAALFVVLGVAVVVATSNTFAAAARLLTRPVRDALGDIPLSMTNLPDTAPDAVEDTIRVQPVLERAAAAIGDLNAEQVGDVLTIEVVPRSRVVLVGARARTPARAALIANATVAAFLEVQSERFRAEVANAEKLLESRADDARKRLAANQDRLAEFAASKGLFDPDTEITSLLQETAATEAQIRGARTSLESARSRLEFVKQLRSKESETVTTKTTAPSARSQIVELEAKRAALLARYLPAHPLIQELDAQIEALRELVRENRAPSVQSTTQEPNPIYQQLYLTEVQTEIEVRSLESQLTGLQRTRGELAERARALPTVRAELTQLTVERRTAEGTLDETIGALSRVQELRGRQSPLYELVEEAQAPIAPERGRTALGLVLVALFSLMVGFGVALIQEVRDDRLRDASEAEAFGIQVLGVIPPVAASAGRHDEAIRQVAFAIRRLCVEGDRRCVLVTSAIEREHKTNLARGVAEAMTGWLRPILRIDANLRDGAADGDALRSWLAGGMEHAPVTRGAPGLGVILGGDAGSQAPTLLSDPRMDELLTSARESFRVTILDGPALLRSVDAEILAEKADGVVLVIRAFHTPRPQVGAAIARLRTTGAAVLGIVVTDAVADDRKETA